MIDNNENSIAITKAGELIFDEQIQKIDELIKKIKNNTNLKQNYYDFIEDVTNISDNLSNTIFHMDMADLHGIHRDVIYVEGLYRDFKHVEDIVNIVEQKNKVYKSKLLSKFIVPKFNKEECIKELEIILRKWGEMPKKEKEYVENIKMGKANESENELPNGLIQYYKEIYGDYVEDIKKPKLKLEEKNDQQLNDGILSYISTEDELKKSYELENNINKLVDDFAEKIAKEDKSKSKASIKKDLSNKIIDFIDCASKFGIVNYASSLLVFSILKTCGSSINGVITKLNQVKQNLSELDLACSNTATELVKFSNFNKDNELKLAQFKEDPIKYNFESDKILRLYKEEVISSNDSRFDLIKAKVQSIAKNISADNIELNNKIEKILMKTAMNILSKKVIEKGYDIIPPNSNYIVNGDLKNSKDKTIIKETESLYKTRIKFLEDNGIIKENSVENEEELELVKNSI